MIDKIHILVQAGNGGQGCESYFHRNDRKQVPNGGDGGRGGNIIFRADHNAPPIANFQFKRHIVGETGGHGGSSDKKGRTAQDTIILVPPGTSLYDRKNGLVIRESMKDQEEVVVAEGGRGGGGNHGNKTMTPGEPGAIVDLEIAVRLTADIYLVGLPNAGKSTLLRHLSRSQAKTESYPFTTREPELGVYEYTEYEQLTLCDLPSIYRSSHQGRGLGVEFLKHLETAKCILYMIDPVSEFADSLEEGYEILLDEVKRYNPQFLEINAAVVINKMDIEGVKEKVKAQKFKAKIPIFQISAVTGDGMKKLLDYLKRFTSEPK